MSPNCRSVTIENITVPAIGDLLGSFADSDRAFVDHFADGGNRAKDIAGSYLLVLAGLSMIWFAIALAAAVRADRGSPIIVTASLAAGATIVAGLTLLTVPLSIAFGDLTDDPGLGTAQAVLPQFGTVALAVGAMSTHG